MLFAMLGRMVLLEKGIVGLMLRPADTEELDSKELGDKATDEAASVTPLWRAVAELRRGGAVVLTESGEPRALLAGAEALRSEDVAAIVDLAPSSAFLVITEHRAAALNLVSNVAKSQPAAAVAFALEGMDLSLLRPMIDPLAPAVEPSVLPDWQAIPSDLAGAAIALIKQTHMLPAAVVNLFSDLTSQERDKILKTHHVFGAAVEDIPAYRKLLAGSLKRVAEARVPLAGAQDARMIAFRPEDGGIEHFAIVIGTPDPQDAVLARLHSQCFTGDLLGSLRCDCGDQLRGAIEVIAEEGQGILLYLAQEGRGIGMVNKLRAYALQDDGADTAEANEVLGFEADERLYFSAAEIFRQLGISRLRLMTNNPRKVEAMARCGMKVEERVAHSFPSNGHNEFYLETKAKRMGHLF